MFVSPLARAGDLKPTDSDFLFGKNKVATTNNKVATKTISDKEMKETQGQGHKGSLISIGGGNGGNRCNHDLIGVCL